MEKPEIKIESVGAGVAALERFVEVQGDLKTLSNEEYERLKAEILSQGFSFTPSVWPQGDELFLIDGHQRIKTLRKMREEGYRVPDEIPYSITKADDFRAAKRKVLGGASTYGKTTEKGFVDFVKSIEIPPIELANFRLPEINIPKIIEQHFGSGPDSGDVKSFEQKDGLSVETSLPSSNVRMVQLYFNDTTYSEFIEKVTALEKVKGTGNVTDTVLEIVRAAHSAQFPPQS